MPALPLTPEQKADADRLKKLFLTWQGEQKQKGAPSNQDAISELLGFGQSALSQYLNGKIPLNPAAAAKFAKLLGCQISDFSLAIASRANEIAQATGGVTASETRDKNEIGADELEQEASDRAAVGARLKAAREAADLSQQAVADRFGINKATVSAWETGRGDPGIYRMRDLARLYRVSCEPILFEDAPSSEALDMARQFDRLSERKRQTLRTLWIAFLTDSKDDSQVEASMPATRQLRESNGTEAPAPASNPPIVPARAALQPDRQPESASKAKQPTKSKKTENAK